MAVAIRSDKKWRNFISGYELPKGWRKRKDWIKSDEEYDNSLFVKTPGRNTWYFALEEFAIFTSAGWQKDFPGWDGYIGGWEIFMPYDSGYVIKVSSDGEQYKIGYFYNKGD